MRAGLKPNICGNIQFREESIVLRSLKRLLLKTIAIVFLATATLATPAETTEPLSAADSDPKVMGWMVGFPPPPEKLITQPDSNYFSFPKLRWSVCHLREFLPTETISRGLRVPVPLD